MYESTVVSSSYRVSGRVSKFASERVFMQQVSTNVTVDATTCIIKCPLPYFSVDGEEH